MFIEYLCGLAEAELAANDGAQAFVLRREGTDDIQEIIHYSDSYPGGTRYLVFGFMPVEAALCVRRHTDGLPHLTYTQTNAAVAV